ncbi:MAG: T9SS type A sorting domain-containing protein [Flavipsychrobacter sp.]
MPITYLLPNQTYKLSNILNEHDGDSISVTLVDPQIGPISCTSPPTNVSYSNVSPSISLIDNPFQTNNSFTLDSKDGSQQFTAYATGSNTVRFKISEYRNNVLIGYITRETQIEVIPSLRPFPKALFVWNPASPSAPFYCVGQPITFTWYAKMPGCKEYAIDNHANLFPGSSVTYYNQYTDSVSGAFTWTPTNSDIGINFFIVTATDSTCDPPGGTISFSSSQILNIAPPLNATSDTLLCLGDTISLTASNGDGKYKWRVISGSTTNVLGCDSCMSYMVFPDKLTVYEVASGVTCGANYKDTITVQVKTSNQHPTISISTYPDSVITFSQQVMFIATTTNCAQPLYQWQVNGVDVPGETSDSFLTSGLIDADLVSCRLLCADTCPQPRYSTSASIKMAVGITTIKPTQEDFTLYPNPNNGSFTIAGNSNNATINLEIFNTLGRSVYKNTFTIGNHLFNQALDLNLNPGLYLLRINGKAQTFVVTSGK